MAGWKKTTNTPVADALRGFGNLQAKLFELKSKNMARRTLMQVRAFRSSLERDRARMERFAKTKKEKKA